MKSKLIKTVIRKKLKRWTDEIAKRDKDLAHEVEQNVVVMGGAICSLLDNEGPRDLDVYFRNIDTAHRVIEFYLSSLGGPGKLERYTEEELEAEEGAIPNEDVYLVEQHNPTGVRAFVRSTGTLKSPNMIENAANLFSDEISDELNTELFGTRDENELASVSADAEPEGVAREREDAPPFSARYLTDNALTLNDGVQIVLRFVGEPVEILKYFDFEHCKMWYSGWDRHLEIGFNALEALHNKRLVYSGSRYPVCSLFRIKKFLGRGWRINAGEIVKIAYQISKLDLDNINVLRDQLIGCDHAYFVAMLDRMTKVVDEKKAQDAKFSFSDILFEKIDEFFG